MNSDVKPEKKVVAATTAASVTGLLLWALGTYAFGGMIPDAVAAAVATLVPGLVTYVTAWLTKHTPRPSAE